MFQDVSFLLACLGPFMGAQTLIGKGPIRVR
jgi:hypothetical protein